MVFDASTIGSKIRYERQKAGLTQAQLAGRCGICSSNLRKYETGKQIPKFQMVERIADAIGIPLIRFLEIESEVPQKSLSDYSTLELIQELERRERERL